MKTILEHGKKPSTIKEFICTYCGCVFTADADEYKHNFDRNEDYWSSDCPECGNVAYSTCHGGNG